MHLANRRVSKGCHISISKKLRDETTLTSYKLRRSAMISYNKKRRKMNYSLGPQSPLSHNYLKIFLDCWGGFG